MRLSRVTKHRFERTPDGAVWTATGNAYAFWARYLAVFDEVNIYRQPAARCAPTVRVSAFPLRGASCFTGRSLRQKFYRLGGSSIVRYMSRSVKTAASSWNHCEPVYR